MTCFPDLLIRFLFPYLIHLIFHSNHSNPLSDSYCTQTLYHKTDSIYSALSLNYNGLRRPFRVTVRRQTMKELHG